MADENVNILFDWARSLAIVAGGAGMPLPAVPESSEVKNFVPWAKSVSAAVGGMLPLPSLADDADYSAVLSWAKALDGAARGMGADLPSLPQA
jgi:hypothetical protein